MKEGAVVDNLKTREKQEKDSKLAHIVKGINGAILWVGLTLIRFAQRGAEANDKRLENASDNLKSLNETQITTGVRTLKIELERLHTLGIIDRQGKRKSTELPSEMKNGNSEVA